MPHQPPPKRSAGPLPILPALSPPPQFLHSAADLGIELEAGDINQLGSYLALLLDANTRFNLTRITEPSEAWLRHILDSLTLLPILASLEPTFVADLGSGGGLPGIPLAIAVPHVHFTLIESTGKKAAFLRAVVERLDLANVSVRAQRAEALSRFVAAGERTGRDHPAGAGLPVESLRESHDMVIARAVGRLPVLIELAMPLLKVGGTLLAMKGRAAQEEIAESKAALHALHAHIIDTIQVAQRSTAAAALADSNESAIIVIEKQRKTPRTFPRAPGEAARKPITQSR